MSVIKRRFTEHFTTVPNSMAQDRELKMAEKGFLLTLYSYPKDFQFRLETIASLYPLSYDGTKSMMKRLREKGYAKLYKRADGKTDYEISLTPDFIEEKPEAEKATLAHNTPEQLEPQGKNPPEPQCKKPLAEKPPAYKRNNSTKETLQNPSSLRSSGGRQASPMKQAGSRPPRMRKPDMSKARKLEPKGDLLTELDHPHDVAWPLAERAEEFEHIRRSFRDKPFNDDQLNRIVDEVILWLEEKGTPVPAERNGGYITSVKRALRSFVDRRDYAKPVTTKLIDWDRPKSQQEKDFEEGMREWRKANRRVAAE